MMQDTYGYPVRRWRRHPECDCTIPCQTRYRCPGRAHTLPFGGLGIDADNPITFVVVNNGPAPTSLTVGFDLEKLT